MNLLAHQHLSFNQEFLMVGNFIADAVKGSKYQMYPDQVQTGILLHRAIDTYTDSHPLVLESRQLLYPFFHKYAGVVQDVYYDHFLASNWQQYSPVPLRDFCKSVYHNLQKNYELLPAKMQRMAGYMIMQDWLYSYRRMAGAAKALERMSYRAKFKSNMEHGLPPLVEHYKILSDHFAQFYPLLIREIEEKFGMEIN